jgi:hypothetical protein
MIIHVGSISINIGKVVSCFVILLHLMRVGFGELDEFLTVVVHSYVVLVSHLVANVILDVEYFAFKYSLLAYSIFSSSIVFCCFLRC